MESGLTRQSIDAGASLNLKQTPLGHWTAVLVGPSVTALREVYAYSPHGDFQSRFNAMAAQWRGWDGKLKWRNLEGELSFVATHDDLSTLLWEADLPHISI